MVLTEVVFLLVSDKPLDYLVTHASSFFWPNEQLTIMVIGRYEYLRVSEVNEVSISSHIYIGCIDDNKKIKKTSK